MFANKAGRTPPSPDPPICRREQLDLEIWTRCPRDAEHPRSRTADDDLPLDVFLDVVSRLFHVVPHVMDDVFRLVDRALGVVAASESARREQREGEESNEPGLHAHGLSKNVARRNSAKRPRRGAEMRHPRPERGNSPRPRRAVRSAHVKPRVTAPQTPRPGRRDQDRPDPRARSSSFRFRFAPRVGIVSTAWGRETCFSSSAFFAAGRCTRPRSR